MNHVSSKQPSGVSPLHPMILPLVLLGAAVQLFGNAFRIDSIRQLRWSTVKANYYWMGPGSLLMVLAVATFVAISLTTEVVLELERYRAQDYAGALIAVGLLRDIGPLTVSLAWAAQAAAQISQEAIHSRNASDGTFELSLYIAALLASVPLALYGLTTGFLMGAFYASTLGATSVTDFLESARATVHDKDLVTFFIKLCLINPTVAVFTGAVCGKLLNCSAARIAAIAASTTFVVGAILNCVLTLALYKG